ncbi:heme/hemin ABC transporter substrate-binding protein [Pantoea allii]|uniref:heme/hemin ABC transporter substrate-binding protein n=1 Tax=Pantoea allii TaxID=574096 RepID=UPI000A225981|nr:ABC transporter substrate-binding protein [Pantoea allii]MBW1251228.1 ABC transporter substrate-binding protein [Pantoea allii]MBW1261013.1 ABC transporter substrate-binding protein [Pantoea allii]MBW1282422.1 ABC transporter substrate-binding protein [Pantoea allii]ORM88682.1 hemin ABC transporter substrate-binding protein [Pantoea allii]PBK00337.1 hemin ABC transporter substrate-binding protein [Pantoea allii]
MTRLLLLLTTLSLSLPGLAVERVISIGGDVTQIIYALGGQQDLVARDSTSQHPAQVNKLPNIGYMRQLNAEGILAFKPTLVLVSELAKPSLVLQQLKEAGVNVVEVTGQNNIDAIAEKIATIGHALKRENQAKALNEKLNKQIAALPTQPLPVKVLFIMAHQGMNTLAAGTQTGADGAIRSAGLINAMAAVPHYQTLSQEGIVAAAPDLVVVGEDGLRTLGGEDKLWSLPGLALTPAGRHHAFFVVDEMALLDFGLDTPSAIRQLRRAAEAVKHD